MRVLLPLLPRSSRPSPIRRALHQQRGFAWFEITLLLATLSILGAAGIEAFRRYQLRSQSSEATINIRRIMIGVKFYNEEQQAKKQDSPPSPFPTLAYTPKEIPCYRGSPLYPARPKLWKTSGWEKIGFSIMDEHRYRYRVRPSMEREQTAFFVEAQGDLNCNRNYSLFKLRGVFSKKTKDIYVQGSLVFQELE